MTAVTLPNSAPLHLVDSGAGDPLVLLHGFTGSAVSWNGLIDRLATRCRPIAFDLIGHGSSPAPAALDRYCFDHAIDDVAAAIAGAGFDRAAWLGYSMGGRLALGLALRHPHLVTALLLESATPGIADDGQRRQRMLLDNALADLIERRGIPAFVPEWERLPMWESQRGLPPEITARQRAQRLRNRPAGLANSLRGMGQGAQPSLWDQLPALEAPTLLIAGALDPKFAQIAARMNARVPTATLAIVPNAGHCVHLEQPAEFCRLVESFLVESAGTSRRPEEIER